MEALVAMAVGLGVEAFKALLARHEGRPTTSAQDELIKAAERAQVNNLADATGHGPAMPHVDPMPPTGGNP